MKLALVLLLSVVLVQGKIHLADEPIALEDAAQQYGYIPVNPTYNASLFYWLYESQNKPATDPLVLWLTGGPGCSSELAMFFENGPYFINPSTLALYPNPYGWNKFANLLYVDQPAGTGFSYANVAYIGNETQVAIEMYTFLQGFFAKYPQYRSNPFFITGESYAGHYIPAVTAYIINQNSNPKNVKIPVQAIAIGDGFIDPVVTAGSWGPFVYTHNLVTQSDLEDIQETYASCREDVINRDYADAFFDCNNVFQTVLGYTGNINYYDIRYQCNPPPLCYNMDYITSYLNQASVQKTLGVSGITWEACSNSVYAPFESSDFETSYRFDIPFILASNVRVLIYNGNYDLIVDFYGQSAMLNTMRWTGQQGFNNAANVTWHVSSQVAGNSRTYGNLTYLIVNNAGHMVPHDQPQNALDMLNRFLNNLPWN